MHTNHYYFYTKINVAMFNFYLSLLKKIFVHRYLNLTFINKLRFTMNLVIKYFINHQNLTLYFIKTIINTQFFFVLRCSFISQALKTAGSLNYLFVLGVCDEV